jgi:unsaturated rhamnogalacturonyl hydrolase
VQTIAEAKAAQAPEGIDWNYPQGVMLSGMERTAEVLGDKDAGQFVAQHDLICGRYYEWLAGLEKQFGDSRDIAGFVRRTRLRNLMNLGSLDSCGAMGTQMIDSILRHRHQESPQERVVIARIADWVCHKQDRLPDGTLWRPKSTDADKTMPSGTVWPDDLYMGGLFLIRYSQYTGDRKYLDDAAQNIIHQAALEQDSDGLWFHGYFVKAKQHSPYKWGRGNGWVTMTLVEALSAMPKNDPLRPQLLAILRKQIEGLKKVQAPDGMWRQILDKPELWEETSCTAMFAYGIARAVNRGWIDASNMAVARKAFAALAKRVTPDGAVLGTCQGTNISMDLNYYINRERPDDDPHGRGPIMLAGTEILNADAK